ncbi:hypothetical protein ACS0TY_006403 [Phlomoides rotata]
MRILSNLSSQSDSRSQPLKPFPLRKKFSGFLYGYIELEIKCNFVSRTSTKGLLDKERALGGQHETPQKLKGGANTLPFGRTPDLKLHKIALAIGQASEFGHETSPIPPTKTVQHASSEDDDATIENKSGSNNGKWNMKVF